MITPTSHFGSCLSYRRSARTTLSLLLVLIVVTMGATARTASAAPASVALIANLQQLRQEKQALCAQLGTLNQQRRKLRAAKPSPVTENWRESMDAVRAEIAPVKEQIRVLQEKLELIRAQLELWPAPDAELKNMSASLLQGQDISAAWSAWVKKAALAGQRDPDALLDRLLGASTLSTIKPVYQSSRKVKHMNAVQRAQRAEHRRARNQAALVANLASTAPLPTPYQPQSFSQAHASVVTMTAPPQNFSFGGGTMTTLAGVESLRNYVDQSGAFLDQIDDESETLERALQTALALEQQRLQTLSNVQGAYHDMAMSIISNIGG